MIVDATLWQAAALGLAAAAALQLITWLFSVKLADVSLVDRVWGPCIALAASVYLAVLAPGASRAIWLVTLVWLWAIRLSVYISARNWGHGEERRYRQIRQRHEPHFAVKSLYLVFALQAVLAWVVSAPFLAALSNDGPPLWWLDTVGIALALWGIGYEAVADAQMARFKADAANEGKVMDRGLWRFSRHPNYFGEACTWWGLWIVAMAGAGLAGGWSVVSPLLMTVLLLKVSGVTLLEKDIGERRPGYREYVASTNAFFPGPKRAVHGQDAEARL